MAEHTLHGLPSFSPEKEAPKPKHYPNLVMLTRAVILTKDDNGNVIGRSDPRELIKLDGLWYEVDFIKSVPGLRDDQIKQVYANDMDRH